MLSLLVAGWMQCAQATRIIEHMEDCCSLTAAELEDVKEDLRQHMADDKCPAVS